MNGSARNLTGTKSSSREITNLPLTSPFNANRFEFVLEGTGGIFNIYFFRVRVVLTEVVLTGVTLDRLGL